MCGHKPENEDELDAHHITSREEIPFGGYVAANGITLCTDRCFDSQNCHRKAEYFHGTGAAYPGYTPVDLYARIKSSYKLAFEASLKLGISQTDADGLIRTIGAISTEELEICLRLCEGINLETWELACDELNEDNILIRAYGKGRYVPDD